MTHNITEGAFQRLEFYYTYADNQIGVPVSSKVYTFIYVPYAVLTTLVAAAVAMVLHSLKRVPQNHSTLATKIALCAAGLILGISFNRQRVMLYSETYRTSLKDLHNDFKAVSAFVKSAAAASLASMKQQNFNPSSNDSFFTYISSQNELVSFKKNMDRLENINTENEASTKDAKFLSKFKQINTVLKACKEPIGTANSILNYDSNTFDWTINSNLFAGSDVDDDLQELKLYFPLNPKMWSMWLKTEKFILPAHT
jgi:hypothetical protein